MIQHNVLGEDSHLPSHRIKQKSDYNTGHLVGLKAGQPASIRPGRLARQPPDKPDPIEAIRLVEES